jgi:hypothetical protein
MADAASVRWGGAFQIGTQRTGGTKRAICSTDWTPRLLFVSRTCAVLTLVDPLHVLAGGGDVTPRIWRASVRALCKRFAHASVAVHARATLRHFNGMFALWCEAQAAFSEERL